MLGDSGKAGPLERLELLELTGRGEDYKDRRTVKAEFHSTHRDADQGLYIVITKKAGVWRIAQIETVSYENYLLRKQSPGIRGDD